MKVIVLHGEDTDKSYQRLTRFLDEAKKRSWDILEGEISSTPSLFGKERLILIRKYQALTKSHIKNLNKVDGTLVIYHEGVVLQTFLKTLPKDTKIEKFDTPKIIWNFLDSFSNKSTPTLRTLHQLVETEAVEFVFAVLSRRIRDLYWIKVDPTNITLAPWQISKLKKQSEGFSQEQLKTLLDKFAEIDVDVKTGKGELLSSLDLILAKYLK